MYHELCFKCTVVDGPCYRIMQIHNTFLAMIRPVEHQKTIHRAHPVLERLMVVDVQLSNREPGVAGPCVQNTVGLEVVYRQQPVVRDGKILECCSPLWVLDFFFWTLKPTDCDVRGC